MNYAIRIILGALGGAAMLVASGVQAQGNLTEFRVGFTPGSISQHPTSIFQKTGLDKKNGLKVEPNPRAAPAALYNDFLTGVYDSIPFGGLNVFASMYNKGAPIKLVQASTIYPFPFIVRADSKINSVKDLKGKKLGIPRASYIYAYLSVIFKANGMDLERDAQVQDVGFFQAPSLLERGDFDGTPFLIEHAVSLEKKAPGKFKVLLDPGTEFARLVGNKNVYLFTGVREDWLKKNPGKIGNVTTAYRQMGEYISANPAEAAAWLTKPTREGGADLAPEIGSTTYGPGFHGMKVSWVSIPAKDIKQEILRELKVYVDLKLIDKMPDDKFFME